MDPCHGQLAAALERAASRVLRYGDEGEEGEEGEEEGEAGEATAGGSVAGTGGGVHAVARGGGGGGAARWRAATSALPTLRFDALLGELVHPSNYAHTKCSIRAPHGLRWLDISPGAAVTEPG